MKYKRLTIFTLLLITATAVSYAGFYLSDLVGIGGYDGAASEELFREFQYGKYSDSPLYGLAEAFAFIFLALGPVLFLAVLIYSVVIVVKAIKKKEKNAL